jgi:hypothetical protein
MYPSCSDNVRAKGKTELPSTLPLVQRTHCDRQRVRIFVCPGDVIHGYKRNSFLHRPARWSVSAPISHKLL